jgi:hypothetical protein
LGQGSCPYDRFLILALLGEMNSDDQHGAVRVIHNAINVEPNEEMFGAGLFVVAERNQIDLFLPGDLKNSALRVAFYDEFRYRQSAPRLIELLRNHTIKQPAPPFQFARLLICRGNDQPSFNPGYEPMKIPLRLLCELPVKVGAEKGGGIWRRKSNLGGFSASRSQP